MSICARSRARTSRAISREIVAAALGLKADRFTLDGEIVVPHGKSFSFDALLQRIHPAASRVKRLSQETPALYLVFDLPRQLGRKISPRGHCASAGRRWTPLRRPTSRAASSASRRRRRVTPRPRNGWRNPAAARTACIAKRIDLPYQAGNRDGMQKIKKFRSADCVVGGFRYATNKIAGRNVVGSLLLGLYDDAGLLHHVGFTSAIKAEAKPALTDRLEALIGERGFTGNAPGGPSRWSTERSAKWCPLKPKLVIEVCYDHFSGERFRHGTSILRWRPDKAPRQCTFEQLKQKAADPMKLLK